MTTKDDGGPAFPQMRVWNAARAEYEDTQQYPGMTLRDWFAGQVLAGAITKWLNADASDAMIAEWAYETADAMLAARK